MKSSGDNYLDSRRGELHQPRPQWATVAFVLLLFALTLGYSGAGFNLHLLSLWAVTVLIWFVWVIYRIDLARLEISWGWLPVAMVVYFGWLMLAPLLSGYPYASFTRAMGLAVLPLVFLARVGEPTNDEITRTWLERLFLMCAAVIAIWGIADFVVMRERAHAMFLDPNAYAALINLLLIPLIYLYLGAPSVKDASVNRRPLLFIITLLALGQSMSLSRGALMAFLGAFVLILWLQRKGSYFWTRTAGLAIVLLVAHGSANMFAPMPSRSITTLLLAPEQAKLDSSIYERLLLLKSAWQMVKESNFLIGNGLGTFKILYPKFRDPDESSAGNFVHNDYLQALQEGGLIQLMFFIVLTVMAPLWLLVQRVGQARSPQEVETDIVPGLLVAVGGASLHALVNFIHYVGPLAFLIGLYMAYSWEAVTPRQRIALATGGRALLRPRLIKVLVLLILAAPVAVLTADGIIFKTFATTEAVHARMSPADRMQAINIALAFRPGNPMPRILLIRALLAAAENSESTNERAALLTNAEREIKILANQAPALALAQHYFPARVLALKGSPSDLMQARDHLQQAVRLVPPATTMRLELVRTYAKLGQIPEVHKAIADAKKWVRLEIDLKALAQFASEAERLSREPYPAEAAYWSFIQSEISRINSDQKLTTATNPVE